MVVHGPEIIDSGYFIKIYKLLKNYGNVIITAKLGGTMGRVSVIDNKLEDIIDISEKIMPSQSLKKLENDNDVLILLNYGKFKETGHTFGKIVVERSKVKKTVIQIERPGEFDGTILLWNFKENEEISNLVDYLSKSLNLSVENCISDGLTIWEENGRIYRKLHGVEDNEAILLNGVVIGRADSNLKDSPILVCENGYLIDIINGKLKYSSLDKLGKIDIKKVVVKTGILRRHPVCVNNLNKSDDKNNKNDKINNNHNNKNNINKNTIKNTANYNNKTERYGSVSKSIVFIDHSGEDVVDIVNKNKDIIPITIGDDTTTICGDILYRFNIPIIGITDGDKDNILIDPKIKEGSVIFLILNSRDDDVATILKNNLDTDKKWDMDKLIEKIESILNKNNIKFKINKIN